MNRRAGGVENESSLHQLQDAPAPNRDSLRGRLVFCRSAGKEGGLGLGRNQRCRSGGRFTLALGRAPVQCEGLEVRNRLQ